MIHTPGPWKWWTSCSWRRLYGNVHEREQAVLMPTVHRDHQPDITVTDADMALIEGAPDLLDSLRECADYVKREIDSLVESHTHPGTKQIDPDDLAYIDAEREILARAEAAIAKAEGKK